MHQNPFFITCIHKLGTCKAIIICWKIKNIKCMWTSSSHAWAKPFQGPPQHKDALSQVYLLFSLFCFTFICVLLYIFFWTRLLALLLSLGALQWEENQQPSAFWLMFSLLPCKWSSLRHIFVLLFHFSIRPA